MFQIVFDARSMACLEMLNIAVDVPQQNIAFRYLHRMHSMHCIVQVGTQTGLLSEVMRTDFLLCKALDISQRTFTHTQLNFAMTSVDSMDVDFEGIHLSTPVSSCHAVVTVKRL